jgi:pimeloyl-ACP methyl ester carboxylesterase
MTATTSTQLTAKDGTTLAVDRVGQGDTTLILVGGAFNDRSTVAGLGAELAGQYTVLTYDRRGRGASDDKAADYAVANEVDDLAAVIAHAGGHAGVFGHSSGGVLALEGAMAGLPIDRLAVYEPAYSADEKLPRPAADVYQRLKDLVGAGDKAGTAELFLRECIGVPEEGLAVMKEGPAWGFLTDKAPSLPYDVLLSKPWTLLPAERLAAVSVPLLAVYGDRTALGLAAATRAVATTVPGAELVLIEGEDHAVLQRPAVLAPILAQFFG